MKATKWVYGRRGPARRNPRFGAFWNPLQTRPPATRAAAKPSTPSPASGSAPRKDLPLLDGPPASRSIALCLRAATLCALAVLAGWSSSTTKAWAEGSRTLYPSTYPTGAGTCANTLNRGCRANLDLQPGTKYVGKVQRRTFLYVYAEAGEYVLLGSSNRATGGDILVYNPQDFGTPGDETLPGTADFSCASPTPPAGSFGGGTLGQLTSRVREVAGPHSADGTVTVPNGFTPCAYRAPSTGIYGVLFRTATSGNTNLNADIFNPLPSTSTTAAWDVTVRATPGSVTDINGRLFTYAWVGFTGQNLRPVYSRHDYVTLDGFRYAQSLAGMDPSGFALYANRLGFLDQGQPLYKGVRGSDSLVTNLAAGLSAQRPEFPIFFSSVAPAAPHATQVNKVLAALGIPLAPQPPALSAAVFTGRFPGDSAHTRPGSGGTFRLSLANASTYQIVVSRDGVDFSPQNTANAVLTGIAASGTQDVTWDGNDAAGVAFPPSGTAYAFRATARAGEIHLPMIDVENNGNGASAAAATFGGGPTVTKLNGPLAGDTTVYFDDRGYVTRSGALVGQVNGSLCPATPPPAPNPAQALAGVNSTLVYGAVPRLYRWWVPGTNANSDCAAAGGWGDAKGLDLWTYVSTAPVQGSLWVDALLNDVAASVFVPAAARPATVVQGRFAFTNPGQNLASGLQYTLTVDRSCADSALVFANLPVGATAQCVDGAGLAAYTFTGFPSTLAGGAAVVGAAPAAPMTFTYTAPAGGSVSTTASVASAGQDELPANNTATGTTVVSAVDLQTAASAPLTALAGETVSVLAAFSNLSGSSAAPWAASITIGSPGLCPVGVLLVGGPPGVALAGVDPVTCALSFSGMPATLADGQILSFHLRYQAPALGTVPVTTTVATSGDANAGNNSATAVTTVAVVNMVISLSGMPLQAIAGQAYAGTFTCTNAGLLDALTGTRCTIDSGLPAGVVVSGCVLDRTGAPWAAGDPVPAGASVVCSVAGTPQVLGPVVISASTDATGEAVPADNTATLNLNVVAQPGIPTLTSPALWLLAVLMGAAGLWLRPRRTGS